MAKTRITISFESKTRQAPYFMIVKEYYDKYGVVEHAKVLYQEDDLDSDIAITGNVVLKVTETGIELHGETSAETIDITAEKVPLHRREIDAGTQPCRDFI